LFLVTYTVLLVAGNVILQQAAEILQPIALTGLSVVAWALALGLLATYFVVYGSISSTATQRLTSVQKAVSAGKPSVAVPRLPFTKYVHVPDPTDGLWETRYKLFYGVPQELDITLSK